MAHHGEDQSVSQSMDDKQFEKVTVELKRTRHKQKSRCWERVLTSRLSIRKACLPRTVLVLIRTR